MTKSLRIFIIGLLVVNILFCFISEAINEYEMHMSEKYAKAIPIEDKIAFDYAILTSPGYGLLACTIKAVNPVSIPELEGEYTQIEIVTEHYVQKTRVNIVTKVVNGQTVTEHVPEIYWTWETVSQDSIASDSVSIYDHQFETSLIDIPNAEYADLVYDNNYVRRSFYTVPSEINGVLFSNFINGSIGENTFFRGSESMEDVREQQLKKTGSRAFYVLWVLINIGALATYFINKDN